VSPLPSESARQLADWETLHRAVAGSHERVLARIEDAGVPRQWFAVVHRLYRVPDHRMPMSRLARELVMTSGGFTKLADRMGREGLIDRRGSEGDRRVVFASLTADGLALAERAELAYLDAVREVVLGVLPPGALDRLATEVAPLAAATAAVHAIRSGEGASTRESAGWDPSQPERRRRAIPAEPGQSPQQPSHQSPI
jgi:DNA-binding MarR family transcriptional regulator